MLEPLPGRSVARFMLPLADVMTVLFSLFLLLPHLEQRGGRSAGPARTGGIWTPEEQLQARDELARHRRLAELPTSERLQIVVLLIDEETGRLLARQGASQMQLADAVAVKALVERHRAALPAGKQLLYVLQAPSLAPGKPRRRPTIGDEVNYTNWFRDARAEHQVAGL